jgi:hypothetical protein
MRALSAGIPDPYLASIPAAMLPKLMASGSSTSYAVTKPAGGRKARHSVERRTVSQVTTSHVLRSPPCVCVVLVPPRCRLFAWEDVFVSTPSCSRPWQAVP